MATVQEYVAPEPELQSDADLTRLRVLVVDDHPGEGRGSAGEGEPIDVAVVDYQLGSRSGLWLTRMLKRLERAPRVVIYSAYCDGPLAAACVVAGADGLISKGGVGAELCHAGRAVAPRA